MSGVPGFALNGSSVEMVAGYLGRRQKVRVTRLHQFAALVANDLRVRLSTSSPVPTASYQFDDVVVSYQQVNYGRNVA